MKIDNSGTSQIGNLQRVRTTTATAGSSRAGSSAAKASDRVELSGVTGSFEADHVRHVANVSVAVAKGTYQADAQAISAKIIEEHLDHSLAA